MNNWFLIAILSPILWGIVNHADKFLLSKYLVSTGVGAILIFSCLFALFLLPFIMISKGVVIFSLPFIDCFGLMGIGMLNSLGFVFYLTAMEDEEASVVVPLMQLAPIFSYTLGYIILGEILTSNQLLASLLILLGVAILSFEIDIENRVKIKKAMVLTVCCSTFFFALSDTIFKKIAIDNSFWISTFWQYVGVSSVGILCIAIIPKYRMQFLTMMGSNNKKILSINAVSEVLYLTGNLANNFSILLAPVALVSVVCSCQPLFVFILGTVLSFLFPKFVSEKISKNHLIQKGISIGIIVAGSVWLYLSGV